MIIIKGRLPQYKMPTFNEMLFQIPGLRYISGELELISRAGRRMLDSQEWESDGVKLAEQLFLLGQATERFGDKTLRSDWNVIEVSLMQIRDIGLTLRRLGNGESLDDVELFEVKGLAMASDRIRKVLPSLLPEWRAFPSTREVVELLDPDATGASSFHIYDSYSPELESLRKRYNTLVDKGDPEAEDILTLALEEEGKVRRELCLKIKEYTSHLREALDAAGRLDLLIAKCKLNIKHGFTIPEISEGDSYLKGLWNPEVSASLQKEGRDFQKVDLTLSKGLTLITGANMGGKSVLLKSLSLIWSMMQFGFGVPAAEAQLVPVRMVLTSFGDGQSELEGLSSFAAEMKRIDVILRETRTVRCLALIDEPARTTNPEEGAAIAEALAQILAPKDSIAVMTTHYSFNTSGYRRLRVRGLDLSACQAGITSERIGELMDYSLVEDGGQETPHEALRIAALLGVDDGLIKLSAENIKKHAKE